MKPVNAFGMEHYWAGATFVRCVTSRVHVRNMSSFLIGNPSSTAVTVRQFEVTGNSR